MSRSAPSKRMTLSRIGYRSSRVKTIEISTSDSWTLTRSLVDHAVQGDLGQSQRFPKGTMLHWQGDPVEDVVIITGGAVKVFSVSMDGKIQAYAFLGAGSMVGATACLLGKGHETMAEAIEETEGLSIPRQEFQRALVDDPDFSMLVMRSLAEGVELLAGRVRDLSLLDVRSRLKHALMELAAEHGVPSERGLKIDLPLTHQQLGELVAANRTTITSYLGEWQKKGYLWKEGPHLCIIPPRHIEILDSLELAVLQGQEVEAERHAREALGAGVDPALALEALAGGMRQVDRMFARDELELPDIILASFAMKRALPVVEGGMKGDGTPVGRLGTIVIGTVRGDIHDIGGTMVSMLLKARGFNVIDLGINVSADAFLAAVKEHKPKIIGMSSLMTTTVREQFTVIRALTKSGLRQKVKVMVGGGAVTPKLCEEMGADGFEPTAHRAAELAWRLVRPSNGRPRPQYVVA